MYCYSTLMKRHRNAYNTCIKLVSITSLCERLTTVHFRKCLVRSSLNELTFTLTFSNRIVDWNVSSSGTNHFGFVWFQEGLQTWAKQIEDGLCLINGDAMPGEVELLGGQVNAAVLFGWHDVAHRNRSRLLTSLCFLFRKRMQRLFSRRSEPRSSSRW